MAEEEFIQAENSSSQLISQEDFRIQYNQLRPKYERLAINLQQALKTFLLEKQISYLDVLYRIKDHDSAYEKISRKEYEHPFEQIEDWCGLRIICYYPSDVERICTILKDEFDIQTQEDTAKRLAPHEFGYRSTHFVLKVKSSWMQPPNYRGLNDFKAEVQIRTILMHAWAEIEHKLQYKQAEQVPEQFQRKLYLLSAKFEEADGQFEELRNGIAEYRASIKKSVNDVPRFRTQELNLDTLQALLDANFPEREKSMRQSADVFRELIRANMSMADIIDGLEYAKSKLQSAEEAWRGKSKYKSFTQSGALRTVLDMGSEKYHLFRYNRPRKF